MDVRERKRIAKEMYEQGASLQEMQVALEYKSTAPVGRILGQLAREGDLSSAAPQPRATTESGRTFSDKLDDLLDVLWPEAMEGKMGAIDRCLKIMEMRQKLGGSPPASPQPPPDGEEESALERVARRVAANRSVDG